MPKIIPKNPHSCPISIDSYRNCRLMIDDLAPIAFRIPISFVLSVTDTSIIFINPIAAPNKVMIPIIVAAIVT